MTIDTPMENNRPAPLLDLPPKQGLYDPRFEHDACGVGFIAHIKGQKSHAIVAQGLQILQNLDHRGACGCEENTGDGAGILLQMPHKFLVEACAKEKLSLPAAGQYGTGLVFLPHDAQQRRKLEQKFEKIVRSEGQHFLGWRTVPTVNRSLGETAKASEPHVRMPIIGRDAALTDDLAFERKLYVIRKRAYNEIRCSTMDGAAYWYVCSLSYKTIVYKGMLLTAQVGKYFPDLKQESMESGLALVHSRFSTNTFPSWARSHPYRYIAHNGEINTLRGNINWMHARQALFESDLFGEDIQRTLPVIDPNGSDSAMFDNCLELLVLAGRSLPHALMMMIPEPWTNHESMSDEKKAFYEFHSCLMEPWDGPASIAFTDGKIIGATLDRNGLRPTRYYVTKDDLVIMASEAGVLDIAPENVLQKGRLQPGRMFLVDTEQGRIVADEEIKDSIAKAHPYRQWLDQHMIELASLPDPGKLPEPDHDTVLQRQQAFGYTFEDLRLLMVPMARDGVEAVGSMGTDTPLAVLSDKPQSLFSYFKQLFAQVTNPPIDCIREEIVTSAETTIGSEKNLLNPVPESCHLIELKSPILTNEEFAKLKHLDQPGYKSVTFSILYPVAKGAKGLEKALNDLFKKANQAIADGISILILSDRGIDAKNAAIPSLLAVSGLHHHLIRKGTRTRVGLVLESGEPREVHHFSLLIGYGCGAINPYLAFETLDDMIRQGLLVNVDHKTACKNFAKAAVKGVVKVASKMGISTIQSYRGAQIFEAIGLSSAVVDKYFTWTASRVEGVGMEVIAKEVEIRHRHAFPERQVNGHTLDVGGQYQWRSEGEYHLFNPQTVHKLQSAVRGANYKIFKEYSALVNDQNQAWCTLRGLLDFKANASVPIEEVESVEAIVKRFKTGAMSYGSISSEAHEALAIAMNRIGGRSNTGEGGEDPARYRNELKGIPVVAGTQVSDIIGKAVIESDYTLQAGDSLRSKIKQVASGRFGVTTEYLVSADQIQIKMAQGAKPGEGGQLPGGKVTDYIGKLRYSVPGVGLISPPPHHDIYSIEDLAQLIHDLKNANPRASVSVKLVSEVGVGTIAAGVTKCKADHIVIAGHDGGTGASPWSSIKHCGTPWELGLAETQQTLVLNRLRGRVRVQADGQMKTGRDVVIGALLGADEFGFATAPLVVEGCIMMRKCHLNTCPVGVATQDPVLRKKFSGKPEHVVNFFFFIAEEARQIMAQLGIRKFDDLIGRADLLDTKKGIAHWKASGLDFSRIFHLPQIEASAPRFHVETQDHGLTKALDVKLIERCQPAILRGEKVHFMEDTRNLNRSVGAMLSGELIRHRPEGLPDHTIFMQMEGVGGQSFGAFLAKGITLYLIGDANDYTGKGLSGGRVVVRPSIEFRGDATQNIIIGNTALYGATSGEAFFRGVAGERFAVRLSGATAVVEGTGDHGCEYMTGGTAVVLGKTGRNFAAGMSGGVAYVYDEDGLFAGRCNTSMVALDKVLPREAQSGATVGLHAEQPDETLLKKLIEDHHRWTGSLRARELLDHWPDARGKFIKVFPHEYKRVLAERAAKAEATSATSKAQASAAAVPAK